MHDVVTFDDRIWDLARGAIDPELETHISTCPECQRTLALLRHAAAYRAVVGGPIREPSPDLVAATSGLFRRIRPDLIPTPVPTSVERLTDTVTNVARRVLATLVFDSGDALQPAGLRGATESGTRQLVFESDAADLDLELTQGDGADLRVVGQLGMDDLPAGLEIMFSRVAPSGSDDAAVRMPVGVDGYFRGTLTSGKWAAQVEMGDAAIVFESITL